MHLAVKAATENLMVILLKIFLTYNFLFPNKAKMIMRKLWIRYSRNILTVVYVNRILAARHATKNYMVILALVFVMHIFYFPINCGWVGCDDVVG